MVTGYSGTALATKLGIRPGFRVYVAHAPSTLFANLAPLPDAVQFTEHVDGDNDLAHLFVTRRDELNAMLGQLRVILKPDAAVWVSWPKKSARVASEVGEDTIREIALPHGWVDVKVCAVDDVWSALKLVVRKALR